MNKNRYKLIYSAVLNSLVPVSEVTVGSKGKGKSNSRRQSIKWIATLFKLALGFTLVNAAWGDTVLPAGISIQNIQGNSTRVIASDLNKIQFEQLAPRAIVDFNRLNLAKGQEFNVNMQSNWSMLNRIHDVNPSVLNGMVNAAGNIYFINSNGIIIGSDAQFNVGSLYAGTLNITNQLFQDGFVNEQTFTNPFSLVATIDLSNEARQRVENAQVLVESGARINAAKGRKVMLFAPNVKVEDQAIIKTPDGQTILAAGERVWLRGSADPAGFLVEVDGGGTATNLGQLIAERGNVSMMGLAVNQNGTVSASTSVRANGSVRLIAQDRVNVVGVNVTGRRNGVVSLGKGSVTEVRPETNDKEESIVSQPFKTSEVLIEASMINIDGAINAKGGNVTARAEFDASALLRTKTIDPLNNGASRRIMLGPNASIDVSGVNALAPMSRNQLEVQLFSDQLKDAPILRGGELFRTTVYVDARKGTDLFDIQPFLDLKPVTVSERMVNAGNVTLSTSRELILSPGSVINVSGGSTRYSAGSIKESQLNFDGKLVPISEAVPGVPYDTLADSFSSNHPRWGAKDNITIGGSSEFVASYFEGANAGTVNLTTPISIERTNAFIMSGELIAKTMVSREQLISQHIPLGGQLIASARNLTIGSQATVLDSQFSFADVLPNANNFASVISTSFLDNGFNRIDFSKVDQMTVNQKLNIASHGSLVIGSSNPGTVTRLNADIHAPNSDITLEAFKTILADNVSIKTAGKFTNDSPGIQGRFAERVSRNAGKIALGETSFGQNVTLDASAGASVDYLGHFEKGSAGNISFKTYDALPESLSLRSYGFDRGGELTISFGDTAFKRELFVASNLAQDSNDISLESGFFNQGGFSKYKIQAYNITIGDSQDSQQIISSNMHTWQMNPGFLNAKSQSITNMARPVLFPSFAREASALWFESPTSTIEESVDNLGIVTLAANTTLQTDRGGSVTLRAGKQVNVLGDINTPSGNIDLSINDVNRDIAELPNQMVFIGADASLTARGSVITLPDSRANSLNNQVVGAGTISINTRQGAVLKAAVVMKQGSLMDVSGVAVANDTRTKNGIVNETLFGDAGTIHINGSGSMLLDGNFLANATGSGQDGSLNLLFNPIPFSTQQAFPFNSGKFFLSNTKQLVASELNVADALKNNTRAATLQSTAYLKGQISAEQIEQAGFANVAIKTYLDVASPASTLVLNQDVDLSIAGNLMLDSPITQISNSGTASLAAGHITLRSPIQAINQTLRNSAVSLRGNGRLNLTANQLYIDGVTTLAGVNQTNISTRYDIHGQGARSNVQFSQQATDGGLLTNGELNLTARQIYPESGAQLSLIALGDQSQINLSASQLAAKPILSAGGTLNLEADSIQSNGVLSAPFGVINLNADQIVLGANSVTTVSANNSIIPFGITTTAGEVYNPLAGKSRPLLESAINLQAQNISLNPNSTIDLSASGDMFAYEWIPGLGGTSDFLAQPDTYAVIPNFNQAYAPRDLTMSQSSAPVLLGKTVFLNGDEGPLSGQYTLLPARYALLPGAYVVQLKANQSLLLGQVLPQPDGSFLTTGYFGDLSTGARDAQVSTFSVFNGDIFRPAAGAVLKAPSQYAITSASDFFKDPAKIEDLRVSYTPKDVAKLGLNATQLLLDANVLANRAEGGRGLFVDIAANSIRVLSRKDNTDSQSLQLEIDEISRLGAQSLLLGGARFINADGVEQINTIASSLSLENDASQILSTPELMLTAQNRITVNDGAVINTGNAVGNATTKHLLTSGDGALLALSSLQNLSYSRQNASANASTGELLIANNSQLLTGNSAVLDATNQVRIDGVLNLQAQGNVTLGANLVMLGDAPSNLRGLKVSNDLLTSFGNLSSLVLNSYSNIETFGSLNLGNQNLNLTLNAAGLVGNSLANGNSNHQVVINANQLVLKNSQGSLLNNSLLSSDTLSLNAKQLILEGSDNASVSVSNSSKGQFAIQGYRQLNIEADEVRSRNIGSTTFDVNQVTMEVGRVAAESSSIYTLAATGLLQTQQMTPSSSLADDVFAGRITLQANDLVVGSRVESASGIISLQAQNNLRLNSQAQVNANSQLVAFADLTRPMPAGQINLSAINGDVVIDSGAIVTVNAVGDASAGTLNIQAQQGSLQLSGLLQGNHNPGAVQGASLNVDVNNLADLSGVNSLAEGFNFAREYRVRQGDITISGVGQQALSAQHVAVTADQGQIIVTGAIDTRQSANGTIGLYAQHGLTLSSTARLDASTPEGSAKGGRIDLHTASGVLDLQPDSTINVAIGAAGQGGTLHMRAPRTGDGSGSGVAVNQLSSNVIGAKQQILEAVRVFNGVASITAGNGTGDTLGFDTINDDVTSFMANRAAIETSLAKTAADGLTLQAGIEITNNGNITIGTSAVDWNLFSTVIQRTANDVGVISLRATGDLQFNGGLSDGFTSANRNLISTESTGLLAEHAWSYRLVAGADLDSSNVLNTQLSALANGTSASGNLILANDKVIRTGTGFIDIATGGDLRLGNQGAVIYTAGRRSAAMTEFTNPPSTLLPLFLEDGGDINIHSQRNVVGAEGNSGRQMVNQWLFRQGGGTGNRDTAWWVRPDQFRQGVATLGGGNISIVAGGDILNFSASAPTTARVDNFADGTIPATGNTRLTGGGDVNIQAGGNIVNGTYFVAKGEGRLTAGAAIEPQAGGLGTVLALQDGKFAVTASDNIYISTTFNPTLLNQSSLNTTTLDSSGSNSNFNSYSTRAGVSLISSSGSVGYGNGDDVFGRNTGLYNNADLALFFGYNPSKLALTSFAQDITFGSTNSLNNIVMLPAADGQLSLLAANNISLGNTKMSDADVNLLPNINSPLNATVVNVMNQQLNNHSAILLHGDDDTSALIIANKGNIDSNNRVVTIPKATKVIAGGDITNINFGFQNNRASDVTLLKAGRDINTRNIVIAGPGELLVQAGRNVDLIYPEITTINSTGNAGSSSPSLRNTFAAFANPALPSNGAAITLQAGLNKGAAVSQYISQYILPTGAGPATIANNAERLAQYRQSTANALTKFMRAQSENANLDDNQALNLFVQQSLETQTVFVNRHLVSELVASGRDFAKAGNHDRGNQAIQTLFPEGKTGNILLFNSKVSTNSGGSIDLIAPNGLINVGVPGQGGDIGIITEKGGEIRAVSDGDFQVNQSKVITQFGSDIAVWSTNGTIDAGRGSKTATSIPERIVQTDAFGNTLVEVRGVAAGSGIRSQSYDPDGPSGPLLEPLKGNVSLIAPVVDAGEAGIEAGDLLIVAPVVLNAANIQVQGIAAGVPIAAGSSIAGVSAGLSPDAINSATQAVAKSVAASNSNNMQKPKLPSMISVDVISIGNKEDKDDKDEKR